MIKTEYIETIMGSISFIILFIHEILNVCNPVSYTEYSTKLSDFHIRLPFRPPPSRSG